MLPDGIVWRRVRMDFKDLSVATPQEELAEKCAELMDGLRCRHLLLYFHNYIPVLLYPKDFSLWNSQPVQTKPYLPAAALTPKPSPPKYIHYIYYFLKFVFLSCGTAQRRSSHVQVKFPNVWLHVEQVLRPIQDGMPGGGGAKNFLQLCLQHFQSQHAGDENWIKILMLVVLAREKS